MDPMTKPRDVVALAQARTLARSGRAKAIRERAGITRDEVARCIGVSAVTIWRWEHARRVPRGEPAIAWLSLLTELEGLERPATA